MKDYGKIKCMDVGFRLDDGIDGNLSVYRRGIYDSGKEKSECAD